mmetsp:Transcript_21871/g.37535  ORF Transcript_21871/g.37535 Transcript_21871/m.37535 type:complete len:212 (-) Transcript_21871:350-985(-)
MMISTHILPCNPQIVIIVILILFHIIIHIPNTKTATETAVDATTGTATTAHIQFSFSNTSTTTPLLPTSSFSYDAVLSILPTQLHIQPKQFRAHTLQLFLQQIHLSRAPLLLLRRFLQIPRFATPFDLRKFQLLAEFFQFGGLTLGVDFGGGFETFLFVAQIELRSFLEGEELLQCGDGGVAAAEFDLKGRYGFGVFGLCVFVVGRGFDAF